MDIQKVKKGDFDKVFEILKEFNDLSMSKSDWKPLLNYAWSNDEDYRGYVLLDNEQIVGFVGLIFANKLLMELQKNM